ncbi:hypothetical protein ACSQ6I_22525 [Anabaena sp. WFMT]
MVEQFRELQQQLLQKYLVITENVKAKESENPNIPDWLITASYELYVT